MRLMLKSALRRSWRDRECVQFGVDPERAVVLEPVDGPSAGFLSLLDGTRSADVLAREAEALGLGPDRVRHLLGLLAEGGVLDDASAHSDLSGALRHRTDMLDRLRPDLAALSVVHPGPGAGALRIRHRRASRVRVLGAGRVGAAVASVLSAAGVGAVDVVDVGRVEPWDIGPAGFPAEQVGERRDAAGRGAVRRAAPGVTRGHGRAGPGGASRAPGAVGESGAGAAGGGALTVVAPRDGLLAYAPDAAQARRLVASGVPHLYAGVLEGTGLVGPLVLPGRSGCGECQLLALTDRDPALPRVLAQLRSGRPSAVPACDIALATAVAGLAAAHVLAHLDGRMPPSAGARVELSLSRLSTRVRALTADGRCGCGAAARRRTVGAPGARGAITADAPTASVGGGGAVSREAGSGGGGSQSAGSGGGTAETHRAEAHAAGPATPAGAWTGTGVRPRLGAGPGPGTRAAAGRACGTAAAGGEGLGGGATGSRERSPQAISRDRHGRAAAEGGTMAM
ncbi:ThiF family adenylyltransferase [Streptomyces sp. NBC_00448]|uniref:ThiF family adenylyltransferase n=1 Tax=Streptomyces sp. NBC_00448 TaxID=2903652 RepID=UPI002E1D9BBD